MEQNPVLEIRNLSRTFAHGAVRAVDQIDLDVKPGEIVSILGPSGCGKTTTMRIIAGLDLPTAGEVRILGKDVAGKPPHKRNVGLVFQSLAIFPHMSVNQNVAFGLRMQGLASSLIETKVAKALELVQLSPEKFAGRRPSELSGGQLQRVALARTLVTEPALVLFDEPMAALDRRLRDYMAVELRAIQKQLGIAAVYVTHDQETASMMSDRVIIMNAGKILQSGTPEEIYEAPNSRFVSDFLGDTNTLQIERVLERKDGKSLVQTNAGIAIRLADSAHMGEGAFAIFRPEQTIVHPADPGGAFQGKVISSQFRSGLYRWQILLRGGNTLIAQSTENRLASSAGDTAWVTIDPGKARIVSQ
ncbi:ABC transporter ATP-binding protein [Mesorhizobium sp. M1E.F.Ca.ET.045.02.1.1]|uniref:ABC transporter ATP-binding protein n=1 Tax=Mesorhizobium sp. M1E.F.Ca.ET.045.02.1.1 TaxID=2493672 RepID=UPI000F764179|nr:ABC transporter ATP-binding protein [Mesorhizobium sp. M1E.F.Ca.ET.045.02.1.1]AZO22620.1 ABC transporter ATP-binding protein [Mesorhizobium sp. M1E.F.Ca.ET.045.02.1.1]